LRCFHVRFKSPTYSASKSVRHLHECQQQHTTSDNTTHGLEGRHIALAAGSIAIAAAAVSRRTRPSRSFSGPTPSTADDDNSLHDRRFPERVIARLTHDHGSGESRGRDIVAGNGVQARLEHDVQLAHVHAHVGEIVVVVAVTNANRLNRAPGVGESGGVDVVVAVLAVNVVDVRLHGVAGIGDCEDTCGGAARRWAEHFDALGRDGANEEEGESGDH
ncbi:hypothetical protein F5X68DRAFT_240440, partial [Plectosphaerella plurivora]